MDDDQLLAALERAALAYIARGDSVSATKAGVCRDMAAKFRLYGRWASARQRSYAEALCRWSAAPSPTPAEVSGTEYAAARSTEPDAAILGGLALARVTTLFEHARAAGLERPRIRLSRGEWRIGITPAAPSSRNAGGFYVKASSGLRRGVYCGLITSGGLFRPTQWCPLDVIGALRDFNENPTEVARAYGQRLGTCCFCGLTLTDGRSVAMGYGPICARNYRLPWGDERATSHVDAEGTAEHERYEEELRRRRIEQIERQRATEQLRSRPRGQAPVSTPADPEDEDSHFM